MVITIEPGIYIAADAEVDEKWRGIGVRIEDDILVTANGSECLTYEVPKEVAEIETILSKRGP
jgi:Xaa-Pro aminopeptidase